MLRTSLSRLGLAGLTLASACDPDVRPPADRLTVRIAPLALPGIGRACYDLRVSTPSDTVWAAGDPTSTRLGQAQGEGRDPTLNPVGVVAADDETLCSDAFGDGAGGDITYVGPCDASAGRNTVTVWIDGLYDASGAADVGDWRDPCPDGCALDFDCVANADTRVEVDLAVMREAHQGFFDVAVDFDDIFCSAKLDCLDRATGGPAELLFDPQTGERIPTTVVAFACSAGDDTALYLSDAVLRCGDAAPIALALQSLGNQFDAARPAPAPLAQVAVYRGAEAPGATGPGGGTMLYSNVALGFDVSSAGGFDCSLELAATATKGLLETGCELPSTRVYPVVRWDAEVSSSGAGALACTGSGLDASASAPVRTSYTNREAAPPFSVVVASPTGGGTEPATLACDQFFDPAAGATATAPTPDGAFSVTVGPGALVLGDGSAPSGAVHLEVATDRFAGGTSLAGAGSLTPGVIADFVFRDSHGQPLQLAPGETATLVMPLPAESALAPGDHALVYYYDEALGAWDAATTGEVVGLPTGNVLVAVVHHFSWYAIGPDGDACSEACAAGLAEPTQESALAYCAALGWEVGSVNDDFGITCHRPGTPAIDDGEGGENWRFMPFRTVMLLNGVSRTSGASLDHVCSTGLYHAGRFYGGHRDACGRGMFPGDVWARTEAPCGDGWLESGEDCDDGNHDDGDGCSSVCKTERAISFSRDGALRYCGEIGWEVASADGDFGIICHKPGVPNYDDGLTTADFWQLVIYRTVPVVNGVALDSGATLQYFCGTGDFEPGHFYGGHDDVCGAGMLPGGAWTTITADYFCPDGYEHRDGGCYDVDECALGRCGPNTRCSNWAGGYYCECLPGYAGWPCVDVEECWQDNGGCGMYQTCTSSGMTWSCDPLPSAEPAGPTWRTWLSSPYDESAEAVATDDAGNVYVTAGGFGYRFLTKLNRQGVEQWRLEHPGRGTGIAITSDGAVIVVGAFIGRSDLGCGTLVSDGWDGFVAKYTADGTCVWSHSFGNSGPEEARGVAIDGNGDIYVVGLDEGANGLHNGIHEPGVWADIVAAKYSGSGVLLWDKRFGIGGQTQGNAIVATPDGGVVIAGGSVGAIDFGGATVESLGGGDAFVAKLDAAGDAVWARSFGGPDEDLALGLAVNVDGSLAVVGRVNGAVWLGEPWQPIGVADAFALSLDASGGYRWSRLFGTPFPDRASSAAFEANGNLLVTGTDSQQIAIYEFDPTGAQLNHARLDAGATGMGRAVTIDADGQPVLVGTFGTRLRIGGVFLEGRYGSVWVSRGMAGIWP